MELGSRGLENMINKLVRKMYGEKRKNSTLVKLLMFQAFQKC